MTLQFNNGCGYQGNLEPFIYVKNCKLLEMTSIEWTRITRHIFKSNVANDESKLQQIIGDSGICILHQQNVQDFFFSCNRRKSKSIPDILITRYKFECTGWNISQQSNLRDTNVENRQCIERYYSNKFYMYSVENLLKYYITVNSLYTYKAKRTCLHKCTNSCLQYELYYF